MGFIKGCCCSLLVGVVLCMFERILSEFWFIGKGARFCCRAVELELSRPDLLTVPFLFLINYFLIVMVRVNGDSSILKFKFDFLTKFRTVSLV